MSSYAQHASPAGGAAYGAASPSVIRSQHLPYVLPHQQQQLAPACQCYRMDNIRSSTPTIRHSSPSPSPPTSPDPSQPAFARSQRSRFADDLAACALGPAKPQTPSSMMQKRPSSTRIPHMPGDPAASFKRLKMVGDGFEAQYLVAAPAIAFSSRSSQASPRRSMGLVSARFAHRQPSRSGSSRLYSRQRPRTSGCFVILRAPSSCRSHRPTSFTVGRCLLRTAHRDSRRWHWRSRRWRSSGHLDLSSTLAKRPATSIVARSAFNPSLDVSHAALMRRALEAALSLRNLINHSTNARNLASMKGIFALIRDVLRLPSQLCRHGIARHQRRRHRSQNTRTDGWKSKASQSCASNFSTFSRPCRQRCH